jgi:hypothetical protein
LHYTYGKLLEDSRVKLAGAEKQYRTSGAEEIPRYYKGWLNLGQGCGARRRSMTRRRMAYRQAAGARTRFATRRT